MTYTANTPQATQIIAATQPLIQGNFSYLDTALKVNHTFNGNGIGAEAAGSHQKLDFPNQGSDIAALPAGIAAVQYCIGGNLYTWNGAKRPLSGIATVASISISSGGTTTLVTLPADSMGFFIGGITVPALVAYASFSTISGVGVVSASTSNSLTFSFSGLNLRITNNLLVGIGPVNFKYIYWPI